MNTQVNNYSMTQLSGEITSENIQLKFKIKLYI